jgi:hypothetical protein
VAGLLADSLLLGLLLHESVMELALLLTARTQKSLLNISCPILAMSCCAMLCPCVRSVCPAGQAAGSAV